MFLLGCDTPNVNYPSDDNLVDDGSSNNKSYVVTGAATDITHKSVTLFGEVYVECSDDETLEWGMMYSTDKDKLEARNGVRVVCDDALIEKQYRIELSDLAPETKYYYCAFVLVNNPDNPDFKCGSIKSFETLQDTRINGIGVFSVSADKQVTFSKGNLQYYIDNTWSFAYCQYSMIGTENVIGGYVDYWYGYGKTGYKLANEIDLFCWSTSATNFGVNSYSDNSYYSADFVDWGTNQIGADAPNTWRTLSKDEWNYLLNTRPNANSLKGIAQVNGVNGLVLLPDAWTCPSGITFKSGFYRYSGDKYYADYQTFTEDEWTKLEMLGAVFLPAAGTRVGPNGMIDVGGVEYCGAYWSATGRGSYNAYDFGFSSNGVDMGYFDHYNARSVRLVKDL